jgi:hypothetical protein
MATVSSAPRTTTYTLASATAGPFEVGFRVFDTDKLSVFVNGLPREDWTFVSFAFFDGYADNVQILFNADLPSDAQIVIDGDLTPIRADDYNNGDPRLVSKMNNELGRIWSAISEVKRDTKRSVRGFIEIDPLAGLDPQVLVGVGSYGDAFPSYPTDGWVHFLTAGEVGLYMWMEDQSAWIEISASSASGMIAPFATRAALVTWAQTSTPGVGTVVWAGGFAYRYDGTSTAIADLPGWTWAGTAFLEHFGVVTIDEPEDCTVDYTDEVQAAFSNVQGDLIFTGWVKVTDEVTLPPKVRPHSWRGHDRGGLAVFDDFNLSADAVVTAITPGEGGVIGDLGWWFEQPQAPAIRGDLVAYPPALDISATTRFQFGRLRMENAWKGLYAEGNFGGLKGDVLEVGAFEYGFKGDGAMDFIYVDNMHFWPFGFSANATLMDIYSDGNTFAAQLGRVDGGCINTLQAHTCRVNFSTTFDHLVPLLIGSLHLDGDEAKLVVGDGRLHIGTLRSSKSGTAAGATIVVQGGELRVGFLQSEGAEPTILNVTSGIARVFGGLLINPLPDGSVVTVSAGRAEIRNVSLDFVYAGRTLSIFRQSGTGVLQVEGGNVASAGSLANIVTFATTVTGNLFDAPGMILPVAADNTAALAAGCIVGMPYRTSTGEMRVVV